MSTESVQRVLQARSVEPARLLPPSSLIGLALPIAALGVVLVGMNLHIVGLLLWSSAMGLVGYALDRRYAVAAAVLVIIGGILLGRWVSGAMSYSVSEQLSFVLATLLAWLVGHLGAIVSRQTGELAASRIHLHGHDDIIRAVLEGSRDCIKLLAADGTVLAINESGLNLIGASRESQIVGRHWFDFWDMEQRKLLMERWKEGLVSGTSEFSGSCRILSGERRAWHSTFTKVQLPADDRPLMLCVSRDTTALQRSQQDLKDSVSQLNGLLNSINDAFFALDANWTISFMNRYCTQMFQRNGVEGGVGANIWQLYVDDGNPTAVAMREVMSKREIRHAEYFYAPRSTWLSFTIFPTDGGGIGLFVRDVTVLKFAEKQIEEENARLAVAQEIAGYGDWSFDYELGQMRLSSRAIAMLELGECPPHEYKKRLLERLHPQDRMGLVQAIINSSMQSPKIDLIVRMPMADGIERHFQWVGQLIAGEHNKPSRMLGAVQDVTSHVAVQHSHDKARQLVREIIDVLPQRIGVIDRNASYVTVNQLWEQHWRENHDDLPMPSDFFASHRLSQAAGQHDTGEYLSRVRELLSGERDNYEAEYELTAKDGSAHQYIVQALPLSIDGERMVVFSHSDITSVKYLERKAADNERVLQALADNIEEVFWVWGMEEQRITHLSPAFEKIYKIPREEVLQNRKSMLDFVHPDDIEWMLSTMTEHLSKQQPGFNKNLESRVINGYGELRWISTNSAFLGSADGRITQLAGTIRDITEHKLYEQKLYQLAYRDDLTNLPNRKALLAELERRLQQAAEHPFALMLINLDRFKNINDSLGHSAGDHLLRMAGERLQHVLGENVFLARLSGDEFAALAAVDNCESLAETALACFQAPFNLSDGDIFISGSIGIALCPQSSSDLNELLNFAGIAQQRAKASGRATLQIFEPSMMLPNRQRLALESDLRVALTRNEFELFYQGKFNLANGELIGAEVLLRWHSPQRGMVMPGDFIPMLEETGLIVAVGEWILHAACRQVQQWQRTMGRWLSVAVNVSTVQLSNRHFAAKASAILREYAIPPGVIELEITESALIADIEHGAFTIEALKQAGFNIALDDFGTGYSSLGYLRRFTPTTLKIDRSFVADLAVVENDVEIVAGILQLAHALKIEVVAEGIERTEQLAMLTDLGCEYGQGFLFCKPLPIEQFELIAPKLFTGAVTDIETRRRAASD